VKKVHCLNILLLFQRLVLRYYLALLYQEHFTMDHCIHLILWIWASLWTGLTLLEVLILGH